MKKGIVIVAMLLSLFFVATPSNGEMKITPDSVSFSDNSVQTTASAPTWHQKLPALERFQLVLGYDAIPVKIYPAVLDKETGLVWQRSANDTQMTWPEACGYCYELSLSHRKGWRLPTAEELASLVDASQTLPALPEGHPFINVKLSDYWSRSTREGFPDSAWVVEFSYGTVTYRLKDSSRYVLCVRGGHGYDGR